MSKESEPLISDNVSSRISCAISSSLPAYLFTVTPQIKHLTCASCWEQRCLRTWISPSPSSYLPSTPYYFLDASLRDDNGKIFQIRMGGIYVSRYKPQKQSRSRKVRTCECCKLIPCITARDFLDSVL